MRQDGDAPPMNGKATLLPPSADLPAAPASLHSGAAAASAVLRKQSTTAKRIHLDELGEEEEVRLVALEAAMRERKEMTGSVSTKQVIKLAWFQKEQEKVMREKKLKWYILDPQSLPVQVWDAFTAIALIFTAIVTPLEVAFLPAPTCANEPLFIVNRLVDCIFIIDVIMQFFLSHPVKTNVWESRLHVIARRYLRGWFLLDVCSIFPSVFDIIPVLSGDCGLPITKPKSPLTGLRIIRAFRLLKLLRLVRTPWAMIKRLVIRIATPRATVTVLSLLVEVIFFSHIFACMLGMISTFSASQLNTWMATHGYCRPADMDALAAAESLSDVLVQCASPEILYLQCLWWSVGMLMGAPISLTPDKGPYPRFYADPENPVNLLPSEQVIVIILKFYVAFHWSTVLARFVFVYNNLDKEQKEFQLGWDALNRFCTFFKIEQKMAMELRQYYLERNTEMRARSRRKVLLQFSPKLAEDVVWELDKKWLVRVPCFSLFAQKVTSDELGFFVQVALSMDVSVFVPKDRPPPRKLYIISQGVALYKGEQLGVGHSWGADDVLLYHRKNSKRLRAFAMTYLHVQWLDASTFELIKQEFPRAYLLCRFWTMMHAVGEFLLENLRQLRAKSVLLPAADLEARINSRQIAVENTGETTAAGENMYRLCSRYVTQGGYEIVRAEEQPFRVIDKRGDGPKEPVMADANGLALARHPGTLINHVLKDPVDVGHRVVVQADAPLDGGSVSKQEPEGSLSA